MAVNSVTDEDYLGLVVGGCLPARMPGWDNMDSRLCLPTVSTGSLNTPSWSTPSLGWLKLNVSFPPEGLFPLSGFSTTVMMVCHCTARFLSTDAHTGANTGQPSLQLRPYLCWQPINTARTCMLKFWTNTLQCDAYFPAATVVKSWEKFYQTSFNNYRRPSTDMLYTLCSPRLLKQHLITIVKLE